MLDIKVELQKVNNQLEAEKRKRIAMRNEMTELKKRLKTKQKATKNTDLSVILDLIEFNYLLRLITSRYVIVRCIIIFYLILQTI